MFRPDVNFCLCLLFITLVSCKHENPFNHSNGTVTNNGMNRNEDYNLHHFMVVVSQFKLTNRRTPMKINSKSIIYLYMLILQAGDIHTHPGPKTVKYPCGICDKNVNWNAKALQCDGCDIILNAQTYHPIFTKPCKGTTLVGYVFNVAYQIFPPHFSKQKTVLNFQTAFLHSTTAKLMLQTAMTGFLSYR